MRIGWNNYLADSTVTSDSEDSQFPVSNLWSRFLEKRYQSVLNGSVITVEFQENRTVSAIAVAFTNATGVAYEIFDNLGASLDSGVVWLEERTNIKYITPVMARRVEITLSSDDVLYVGGIFVGDPLTISKILSNPLFGDIPRGTTSKSAFGQPLGRKFQGLRQLTVTAALLTAAEKEELKTMIRQIGYALPVYVDVYEGDQEEEPSLFGTFLSVDNFQKNSRQGYYNLPMIIQESR